MEEEPRRGREKKPFPMGRRRGECILKKGHGGSRKIAIGRDIQIAGSRRSIKGAGKGAKYFFSKKAK